MLHFHAPGGAQEDVEATGARASAAANYDLYSALTLRTIKSSQ